jgi:Mce-associated membrane protein
VQAVTRPDAPTGQQRSITSRRPGRLTVALAALASVGAVALGLLAWDLERMDDRADARKAAQVVAAESVETILSYDHAAYDKGVEAAKSLMTGEFEPEYTKTIDTVRPEVLASESVVKAEVVASSVVSAEPDRVEALLFVNQTTTGKQVEQPRVDLNRVVVTLVRGDDGAWLISDIEAL